MKNFDSVIWFTGEGFGKLNAITPITDNDKVNLIEYLDNGGKLYLSGRDAGLGIENTQFYTEYLNARLVSEISEEKGSERNLILGKEGTIFEQNGYIATDTYLSDIIMPLIMMVELPWFMERGTNFTILICIQEVLHGYSSCIWRAALYSLGEDILSIKSLIMRSKAY